MKKSTLILLSSLMLFSCIRNQPAEQKSTPHDEKMAWWREARFGMFIHWGLYALPAGEWNGEKIPGIGEWIMSNASIPVKDYEKLAGQFNPEKFNAEEWVQIAKNAGMKYLVITSKHHDGFAMFKSKASRYNIADATPFGHDPLKELADACHRNGIRLGFYYSQAQDWHEPGGAFHGIEDGHKHWDPTLPREPMMNYIENKAVPQVKEILENYGGLDILWWDTPYGMAEESAQKLQDIVNQYPSLITNNRLYKPWPGDFGTPEQQVPPTGLDTDWEVCMTMNNTWGYKSYDQDWKSAKTLIRMLTDIASKGGNLLLNVGPTAEGLFPDSSIVRLNQIGMWLKKNGQSIYGTTASPFFKLPWGRCTKRVDENGTTLYLHVFDWPNDQLLRVPGLRSRVSDVYLLSNDGQKFAYKFEKGDLLIHAPNVTFDPINTVIAIKINGKLKVESNMPVFKDGLIFLPAGFADIYNPGYGIHACLKGSGDKAQVSNWADPKVRLEWMFSTPEAGVYTLESLMNIAEPCSLNIKIGLRSVIAGLPSTAGDFKTIRLGEIEITESGNQVISLIPVKENWKSASLISLKLKKKER